MNYYLVCPCCGYKLLKASDGSNVEISCPKCTEKFIIEVKDERLIISKVLSTDNK